MQLDVAPLPQSPIPRDVLDGAETLCGALQTLVERWPAHPALVFLDGRGREQRIAFEALWRRARELQAWLVGCGLRRGGVALLALPTGPELTAAYFGTIFAGAAPALVATPFHRFAGRPVYARLIASILRVARADLLYCTPEVADICATEQDVPIGGTRVLTAAPAAGGALQAIVAPQPDDVAMIQYSSGSTGDAKGVVLSHRAILDNLRSTRDGLESGPDDVSLNWVPLYHDMGLIDTYLRPLFSGSRTVMIPTPEFVRNPALWLWAIHHYRATISWAPNFAYSLCAHRVADREICGLDLSSWRVAVNASEPCLGESIRAFADRFAGHGYAPAAMTPAWGLAETVCLATAHPVGERPRLERVERQALVAEAIARPTSGDGVESVSVGRCLPNATLEIRDEAGHVLAERRVGKIWLRTGSLFERYQGNPELTARVLVGGWLDTGDRGYVADGYLYFVSREKDLIVVGGEKYSPQDVESAIGRVAGVREGCAVAFGVLNEERGTEDVAAVVETKETDEAALEALRGAIRHEVTRTTGLALHHVLLVPPGGISKTTSGKLARSATRGRYPEAFAPSRRST
jgi:acyl-CoA synthetase (AMP-forming)/AMP-acid ligase II